MLPICDVGARVGVLFRACHLMLKIIESNFCS